MIFTPLNILIALFALFNLTAFVVMFFDKLKSQKNNSSRISEGLLFFMASAFASLGVYLGMFVFRHKTKKWYFLIGVPLLMAQNVFSLYFLYLIFIS